MVQRLALVHRALVPLSGYTEAVSGRAKQNKTRVPCYTLLQCSQLEW